MSLQKDSVIAIQRAVDTSSGKHSSNFGPSDANGHPFPESPAPPGSSIALRPKETRKRRLSRIEDLGTPMDSRRRRIVRPARGIEVVQAIGDIPPGISGRTVAALGISSKKPQPNAESEDDKKMPPNHAGECSDCAESSDYSAPYYLAYKLRVLGHISYYFADTGSANLLILAFLSLSPLVVMSISAKSTRIISPIDSTLPGFRPRYNIINMLWI